MNAEVLFPVYDHDAAINNMVATRLHMEVDRVHQVPGAGHATYMQDQPTRCMQLPVYMTISNLKAYLGWQTS